MAPDPARLRATIEHLAAIERPSASDGERQAAEWIRERFDALGAPARVEEERAHGTYWWPIGLMAGAAALAGLGSGRRALATAVGAVAAAGIADDVTGGRHLFRRLLRQRSTWNVVAEAGDPQAEDTLIFVAHHDAAHGGLVFRPELIEVPADLAPGWYAKQDTLPSVMAPVVAGPILVALGALTGLRALRRAGTILAVGSTASMVDIGLRSVVPGANDNLSSVAVLLELARALSERPVEGVRVLLVSTGSEESFMEGMRGFGRRHFPSLPVERTKVVCLESVGSPQLCLIEGEGMLGIRDYTPEMRDWLAECGDEVGVPVRRGLRTSLATDGLIALKAGYPTVTLASITEYKHAANYHSKRDVPENLAWETVADAVRVCEHAIRTLSGVTPRPAAPAPA
jgi:hypothetical protein